MKVLLTDASGLTSRQISTILSRQHHSVHVLSPPGMTLTKLTRHVTKIHTVPPFGSDPYLWFNACLAILRNEHFDVLLCTQEQVAIISAEKQTVEETGVKIAVPEFASLSKVMGKLGAVQTLRDAGLPQPESAMILSLAGAHACAHLLPGYLKTEIGTASQGVQKVGSLDELRDAIRDFEMQGAWSEGRGEKLLLQKEIQGSLLMVCGVFERGILRTWHACVRVHEGPNGGASKKVSLPLPIVGEQLEILGKSLEWHGALSLDAILLNGVPYYIDINPRIVEPMNALLAGIDLASALLNVSLGIKHSQDGKPQHGMEGIETHQLLLALLKKSEEGRFLVLIEVFKAMMGFERYAGSVEELMPMEGDWFSLLVLGAMTMLLVLGGKTAAQWMRGGAVRGYALSGDGWRGICERERKKRGEEEGKRRK